MTDWIAAFADVVALAAIVPCAIVFAQCVVAALSGPTSPALRGSSRPRLGVLVPAHNEETVIRATLESIARQLSAGDRLLVVADNCSDATAHVAAEAGAEVLVRNDAARRGKGFALQAGVEHFRSDPPAVVVVVDADCVLDAGCLAALAECVAESSRPAQACYLMAPPADPRPLDVVSSLAVLVKNRVRPLAMARLRLPCLITGSGSAFPWHALESRSFAGENIVEDMQLAVDLTLAGLPPRYCDGARLTALLPVEHSAFIGQRRRWEHGHLQTILTQGPRLLADFLTTGRIAAAALFVDLSVPPLSLLAATLVGLLIAAALGGSAGLGWGAAVTIAVGLALLAGAVVLAWWRFGRDTAPIRLLLAAPLYVVAKLPIYARFLAGRQRTWERTARAQASRQEASLEHLP